MKSWGLLCISLFICSLNYGQSTKEQLEAQRKRLQQEIIQINSLLQTSKQRKSNVLVEVEELSLKIERQDQLIRLTNRQINQLTQRININIRTIDQLRTELKRLKEDYADMIVKSRQNKSKQNRLMFLLSSESFLQAYKRIQYMKQYADYRQQQGLKIQQKTKTIQNLNADLLNQKTDKEVLQIANRTVQTDLRKDQQLQNELIKTLRKQESKYASQIKKKQRQREALNKEIDRLIREAIAASNRKAGTATQDFALTPEARALAANFKANKGRLPWPVRKGVVTQKFGTQRHPLVRTTTIKSNGVTIATAKGSTARSIFEGTVLNIIQFKGSNPIVLVQHGNYITSYQNLSKVWVKKGDKVIAKQDLGEIFTNPSTDKTTLQFSVFLNTTPQNPASWLYQM